ncbi:probable polygalacturonase [Chenopodium quinoa]|uniref:probable polygalacturonase n=1 Tax=Chenopodium quinoa TaxID=63459 RepID=UPI000B77FBBD|nr:probable polygalacturonase [Chenopodium quinoa]
MEDEKPLLGAFFNGGTIIRRPTWAFLLLFFTTFAVFTLPFTTKSFSYPPSSSWPLPNHSESRVDPDSCSGFFRPDPPRKFFVSITEFGGVGDGVTSNTDAFRKAIGYLKRFENKGGSQLNVPQGRWVTGSFNLTSNFTLFLERGAVILGSQDPKEWPIIEPLPSYGRGRERLGARHISLIHGNSISNVVITGQNGTIDGQGIMWWDLWWNRTLEHTRGHLVELANSHNILIYNLTFRNSPFWTIHPVYCRHVVIRKMTILAPLNAPNTDGIDPDSSTEVCIEDCYIESGDDLVAVKSGWDQYGIAMARPSSNIIVRRISGTTPTCSGVGIGSEMSGGIFNITIANIHVWNSAAGVRIKTDVGRGGYITNISISNLRLDRVKIPIKFSRGANDHSDDKWDPKAIPKVSKVFISNVVSLNSKRAPEILGIEGSPYEGICMRNINISGLPPSAKWHCEHVSGFASEVFPPPCPQFQADSSSSSSCGFT